jgi:hypothetical protein
MTIGSGGNKRAACLRRALLAAAASLAGAPAQAFFLEGEALDTAAGVLALIVIIVVPIVLIVLFWIVHVLPEKIAHKRHHPQLDAIRTLCLLSLVFGGLLWPIAWLWAYSKPVLYKMAYGTDKVDHDVPPTEASRVAAAGVVSPARVEAADSAVAARGSVISAEIARVRSSLDRMLTYDGAPKELLLIRDQLAALEPRLPAKVEEQH